MGICGLFWVEQSVEIGFFVLSMALRDSPCHASVLMGMSRMNKQKQSFRHKTRNDELKSSKSKSKSKTVASVLKCCIRYRIKSLFIFLQRFLAVMNEVVVLAPRTHGSAHFFFSFFFPAATERRDFSLQREEKSSCMEEYTALYFCTKTHPDNSSRVRRDTMKRR